MAASPIIDALMTPRNTEGVVSDPFVVDRVVEEHHFHAIKQGERMREKIREKRELIEVAAKRERFNAHLSAEYLKNVKQKLKRSLEVSAAPGGGDSGRRSASAAIGTTSGRLGGGSSNDKGLFGWKNIVEYGAIDNRKRLIRSTEKCEVIDVDAWMHRQREMERHEKQMRRHQELIQQLQQQRAVSASASPFSRHMSPAQQRRRSSLVSTASSGGIGGGSVSSSAPSGITTKRMSDVFSRNPFLNGESAAFRVAPPPSPQSPRRRSVSSARSAPPPPPAESGGDHNVKKAAALRVPRPPPARSASTAGSAKTPTTTTTSTAGVRDSLFPNSPNISVQEEGVVVGGAGGDAFSTPQTGTLLSLAEHKPGSKTAHIVSAVTAAFERSSEANSPFRADQHPFSSSPSRGVFGHDEKGGDGNDFLLENTLTSSMVMNNSSSFKRKESLWVPRRQSEMHTAHNKTTMIAADTSGSGGGGGRGESLTIAFSAGGFERNATAAATAAPTAIAARQRKSVLFLTPTKQEEEQNNANGPNFHGSPTGNGDDETGNAAAASPSPTRINNNAGQQQQQRVSIVVPFGNDEALGADNRRGQWRGNNNTNSVDAPLQQQPSRASSRNNSHYTTNTTSRHSARPLPPSRGGNQRTADRSRRATQHVININSNNQSDVLVGGARELSDALAAGSATFAPSLGAGFPFGTSMGSFSILPTEPSSISTPAAHLLNQQQPAADGGGSYQTFLPPLMGSSAAAAGNRVLSSSASHYRPSMPSAHHPFPLHHHHQQQQQQQYASFRHQPRPPSQVPAAALPHHQQRITSAPPPPPPKPAPMVLNNLTISADEAEQLAADFLLLSYGQSHILLKDIAEQGPENKFNAGTRTFLFFELVIFAENKNLTEVGFADFCLMTYGFSHAQTRQMVLWFKLARLSWSIDLTWKVAENVREVFKTITEDDEEKNPLDFERFKSYVKNAVDEKIMTTDNLERIFERADADGDGYLNRDEFATIFQMFR